MIVLPKHFSYRTDHVKAWEKAMDQVESEDGLDMSEFRTLLSDTPFFQKCPETCFYCGNKLTIPAVMWQGDRGDQIWLHPACVFGLCAPLLYDAKRALKIK